MNTHDTLCYYFLRTCNKPHTHSLECHQSPGRDQSKDDRWYYAKTKTPQLCTAYTVRRSKTRLHNIKNYVSVNAIQTTCNKLPPKRSKYSRERTAKSDAQTQQC